MESKILYKGLPIRKSKCHYSQSLQLEEDFDFWQDPVIGRSADIMASPEMLPELQQILSKYGIHYTVMIEDVEALHKSNERPLSRKSGYDWEDYYGHDAINEFIDSLGAANSDWVNTVSIGEVHMIISHYDRFFLLFFIPLPCCEFTVFLLTASFAKRS